MVEKLRTICSEAAAGHPDKPTAPSAKLEVLLFGSQPSQVLYILEVVYALLMPAYHHNSEDTWYFQVEETFSIFLFLADIIIFLPLLILALLTEDFSIPWVLLF